MIEIGISPIAFTIGSISVRWYGIFIALAIVWIVLWLAWQVKKGAKISYETVFMAAIVGVPSGIIISRLLHVIDLWGYYVQHPGEIVGGGGLTAYGAILGAALGIWIYSRFSRVNFSYFADLVAPAVVTGQAVIGRIGCTINGCCYGLPTSLPWGVVYTHSDSLYIANGGPLGVAVHPTQVYEILYGLLVFGVLLKLRGRVKPDGSLFLIYLCLYAVWRLGIDFLRPGTSFLFGLHQAQVISIVVLIVCITLLVLGRRRVKAEAQ
jgi:phosphatidylglycerol:prolipoprotein diacylglycerol transferase